MTNPHLSATDELERLAALHRSGALNDAEFATQKAKVLNSPAAPAVERKPKSRFRRVLKWTGVAVAGFLVFAYVNAEYPELFLSGLPKCDSPEARKMVERTVEDESVGLYRGRRIVQWLGSQATEDSSPNLVRCRGRVSLNAGGESYLKYVFQKKDDGIYISVKFD
ncbi:SHOCT domain-containing protein [Oharaeibacter diazotrophicus]|uniref:Putative oligomerization/nucleic acid binding protein n=1 Tax=Oharaeibacter diazotrophicus TaxID=1920512 RepID=A0A4R6RDW6_9HYPH|nr:SHOCT domain-containing protein [Oharaeibacter diazotrophicus]TDP83917.1 putative oligomerization/nucleic acid binding protein [Oharaeibacter diazotrophicus]BBE72958.1 hypothetical protein OHA_1_02563 [Pleomorphomonas sp. SM30]GLS74738.1 hypothetical protein GCM10007904_00730 [Oharaeibacter diazotrophicus]